MFQPPKPPSGAALAVTVLILAAQEAEDATAPRLDQD